VSGIQCHRRDLHIHHAGGDRVHGPGRGDRLHRDRRRRPGWRQFHRGWSRRRARL